jgi:hypothetical protein
MQEQTKMHAYNDFYTLHEYCIMLEETSNVMKGSNSAQRDDSKKYKSSGRNAVSRSSDNAIIRVLPFSKKGLPKLSENPQEAARIAREYRCTSCRETGHSTSADPQCMFNPSKGRYKFGNVYKETSITDFNAGKNKPRNEDQTRGNAMSFNATIITDRDHMLPAPEPQMLLMDNQDQQGNAHPRR